MVELMLAIIGAAWILSKLPRLLLALIDMWAHRVTEEDRTRWAKRNTPPHPESRLEEKHE